MTTIKSNLHQNLNAEEVFNMAIKEKEQGSTLKAIDLLKEWLDRFKIQSDKGMVFQVLNELSSCYFINEKMLESINTAKEAKEVAQNNFGLYSDQTYTSNLLLSNLYNNLDNFERCLQYDKENLQIVEFSQGRNSLRYAQAINDVGLSLIMTNDLLEAENCLNQALELIKKFKDEKSPEMIVPLFNFSLLYKRKKLLKLAYKYCEDAIALNDLHHDKKEYYILYFELRKNLADIYYKLGNSLDSIAILMKLIKFSEQVPEYPKKDLYVIYHMIASNYEKLGEKTLAQQYKDAGQAILQQSAELHL